MHCMQHFGLVVCVLSTLDKPQCGKDAAALRSPGTVSKICECVCNHCYLIESRINVINDNDDHQHQIHCPKSYNVALQDLGNITPLPTKGSIQLTLPDKVWPSSLSEGYLRALDQACSLHLMMMTVTTLTPLCQLTSSSLPCLDQLLT